MSYLGSAPPSLARTILSACLAEPDRRYALADLDEEFVQRVAERGPAHARWWYRRQVATSMIPALASRMVERESTAMSSSPNGKIEFIRELRLAVRRLIRAPGYSVTVVVTLALGLGAATAIFSLADAVLLRPLPYGDPGRLVLLSNHLEASGQHYAPVSGPDYHDYREMTGTFSGVAAALSSKANLTGDGPAQLVERGWVTANFFSVLGVQPSLGRTFVAEEEAIMPDGVGDDGDPPSEGLVISHHIWRDLFAADSTVLGKQVELSGQRVEIIGILPENFGLFLPPEAAMSGRIDVWSVFPIDVTRDPRDFHRLAVFARLANSVTAEKARSDLAGVNAEHRRLYESHRTAGITAELRPLQTVASEDTRPILTPIMLGVGLLLLLACANVSNLMVVRATRTARERAIRAALGSGRWRLLVQFLSEVAVLVGLATSLGVLMAVAGQRLMARLAPSSLPLADMPLDWRAMAVALGLMAVAALLAAALPARVGWQSDAMEAMKTKAGQGRRLGRTASALVSLQVGLSLVLVVGAMALTKSIAQLQQVALGFEPDDVWVFELHPPFWNYRGLEARVDFLENVARELGRIPGVAVVGGMHPIPLTSSPSPMGSNVGPYGLSQSAESWNQQQANYRSILPGTVTAAGLQLISGRTLTGTDNVAGAAPRILIDRTLAEELWQSPAEAVGQSLLVNLVPAGSESSLPEPIWAEVVGVVAPSKLVSLAGGDRETIFHPTRLTWPTSFSLMFKTSGGEPVALGQIQQSLARVDPGVAVHDYRPLARVVAAEMAPYRFARLVMTLFAGVALAVAAIGMTGVLLALVAQQKRDIGIKLAVGAGSRRVVGELLGRGGRYTAAGLALGLVGSWSLSGALGALLFGVPRTDPGIITASVLLLSAIAALASWLPAVRAAGVDPMAVLREE